MYWPHNVIQVKGQMVICSDCCAESLRLTAHDFDVSSKRLKRKMCWKNIKVTFSHTCTMSV